MAQKVIIPRYGQTMTQGTVGKWFVADGGHVDAGQDVYELEYDKATANVQAKAAGTLRHLVKEGESAPVGKPVGVILADGETLESAGFGAAGAAAPAAPAAAPAAPKAAYDADVLIIGGGPGGYVCANKLGMLGKKVILVERDRVGGTCLNRGCIPTKALLQSAELYESVKNGAAMGIEVEGLKANLPQVDAFREKIVNGLVRGVESLLRARKVQTVKGEASFVDAHTVLVKGDTEQKLTAENIVIATGSKTKNPPIPGLDGANVLTSTEGLHVTNLPESVAILGGGVIGMELAVVYSNLGAKVTVLEALDKLVAIMDGEVSDECARLLKPKMDIRLSARVLSVGDKDGKKEVRFTYDGKEETLLADWVLAALGRGPEFDGLGLENIGLTADRRTGIAVNENFETAVPGVYAIGDANGIGMLAHVASAEGITVAEHICGHKSGINMNVVPSCIYCEPEMACVGLTEEQVKEKGLPYKTGKFPFRANGRSMIVGQPVGFVKIIGHAETNEVLGVHIIGPHATELIGECAAVMKLEGCVEDIAQTIHAHPTVSESIMEAAEQYLGGCIHSL